MSAAPPFVGATPSEVTDRVKRELDLFWQHVQTRQGDWQQVQPGREWSPAQEVEHVMLISGAVTGVTRLLLSDATAALDYDIAAEVLETLDADIDPDDEREIASGLVVRKLTPSVVDRIAEDRAERDKAMLELDRRTYLANAALERVAAAEPTEEELRAAYDAAFGATTAPKTEYNAAHILVATEEEAKAIADELAALTMDPATSPTVTPQERIATPSTCTVQAQIGKGRRPHRHEHVGAQARLGEEGTARVAAGEVVGLF